MKWTFPRNFSASTKNRTLPKWLPALFFGGGVIISSDILCLERRVIIIVLQLERTVLTQPFKYLQYDHNMCRKSSSGSRSEVFFEKKNEKSCRESFQELSTFEWTSKFLRKLQEPLENFVHILWSYCSYLKGCSRIILSNEKKLWLHDAPNTKYCQK